jgi:uncharacterized repeat protein (TIGR01451 family)
LRTRRTIGLVALLAWAVVALGPSVLAADNAATGGIGGIDNGTLQYGDGSGQARVSLFSVDLALVKQATDLAGNVLPDRAPVTPGQDIWFILYVDNPTSVDATDIRLSDHLDETAFTYVPGTLQSTIVPAGTTGPPLWNASWSALSDPVGGPDDEASATDTGGPAGADLITFGSDPLQRNLGATLPAASRLALRFRVRVK